MEHHDDKTSPKKTMIRQTRLIKLERIRDETNSLADLARYANTNMNSVSTIQNGFTYSTEEGKNYTEFESIGCVQD